MKRAEVIPEEKRELEERRRKRDEETESIYRQIEEGVELIKKARFSRKRGDSILD